MSEHGDAPTAAGKVRAILTHLERTPEGQIRRLALQACHALRGYRLRKHRELTRREVDQLVREVERVQEAARLASHPSMAELSRSVPAAAARLGDADLGKLDQRCRSKWRAELIVSFKMLFSHMENLHATVPSDGPFAPAWVALRQFTEAVCAGPLNTIYAGGFEPLVIETYRQRLEAWARESATATPPSQPPGEQPAPASPAAEQGNKKLSSRGAAGPSGDGAGDTTAKPPKGGRLRDTDLKADATPAAKLSPSRVKAAAVYEYAIEKIPEADTMPIRELFARILEQLDSLIAEGGPEAEKWQGLRDSLPDNAETFGKYLRDAGIKRYNTAGERTRRISHFQKRREV